MGSAGVWPGLRTVGLQWRGRTGGKGKIASGTPGRHQVIYVGDNGLSGLGENVYRVRDI